MSKISLDTMKQTGKLMGTRNFRSSGGSLKYMIKCFETGAFVLGAGALFLGGVVLAVKSMQDFGKPIDRIGGR